MSQTPSKDTVRVEESTLAQFLPLEVKGVSMHDGSISFGPRNLRIVLGYITNACSFGDFVSSALKGRNDFGAPDTAVTQMQVARELVRAVNRDHHFDELVKALTKAHDFIASDEPGHNLDAMFVLDMIDATLSRIKTEG